MHDLNDPRYTLDQEILASSETLGRECCCCGNILPFKDFRKDSTNRDGAADRCLKCESTPWLSLEENTAMLRERNNNSEALKRQRPPWIESMHCDIGRIGRVMDSIKFLEKLKKLVPGLRWYTGRTEGDLAVYVQDRSQEAGVRYLWYIPQGIIPEYSLHEFDDRDVPIKEKMRGWRTPLLRCILSGMISESDANKEFGPPADGLASEVYRARLHAYRNR